MNAKKWLQILEGGLMVFAISGGKRPEWQWHPKFFLAGALISGM
jgi:hypothetical protein